jgi:hypothetical protein
VKAPASSALGPEKLTDTYEVSVARVWFIHLISPVAVQQSAGTSEAQLNHTNVTWSIGPHVQTEPDVPCIPCIIAYLGCLNVLAQSVAGELSYRPPQIGVQR